MRIAYLDESGTPELTGNTSHFVLAAVSIASETWKAKDAALNAIRIHFALGDNEIHTAWMARPYAEQERIPGFAAMNHGTRRAAVKLARDAALLKRATLHGVKSARELKKNFDKTSAYTHLTLAERREALRQIAVTIGSWNDCTIFVECIDKRVFGGTQPPTPPLEAAFDQIVSRFHRYLDTRTPKEYGVLVQDRNDTVADRLTEIMRTFHKKGTRWTNTIPLLVETPLFVDSRLTSLVQAADVCSYAFRRYLETGETVLFDPLFLKVNTDGGRTVGARHYVGPPPRKCPCRICASH